jgi:hypothetical protein
MSISNSGLEAELKGWTAKSHARNNLHKQSEIDTRHVAEGGTIDLTAPGAHKRLARRSPRTHARTTSQDN